MKNPKMLVLDIDGTLINKAGLISEEDHSALETAARKGIIVALCTGRVFQTAQSILRQLGLSGYHIFFDGALVCDFQGENEVYSRPIPPETARKASELALNQNIMLDFYSARHFYVTQKSWRSDIRKAYFGLEAEIADFKTLWQNERLIKGTLVYNNPQDEKAIRNYLRSLEYDLTFSWSTIPAYPGHHFINLLDKGVSKGQALEALAGHYKMSLNDVMAIGDGANDVPLLAAAGTAVAMQNAPPALLDEADYITTDVEHNGVAEALRHFFL